MKKKEKKEKESFKLLPKESKRRMYEKSVMMKGKKCRRRGVDLIDKPPLRGLRSDMLKTERENSSETRGAK